MRDCNYVTECTMVRCTSHGDYLQCQIGDHGTKCIIGRAELRSNKRWFCCDKDCSTMTNCQSHVCMECKINGPTFRCISSHPWPASGNMTISCTLPSYSSSTCMKVRSHGISSSAILTSTQNIVTSDSVMSSKVNQVRSTSTKFSVYLLVLFQSQPVANIYHYYVSGYFWKRTELHH